MGTTIASGRFCTSEVVRFIPMADKELIVIFFYFFYLTAILKICHMEVCLGSTVNFNLFLLMFLSSRIIGRGNN